MKAEVIAQYAVEDLIVRLQKNASLSNTKKAINDRNRLAKAKAFAGSSQNVLNFIVSVSDNETLEALIASDSKDAICNYKTSLRIADLAKWLLNESCVESATRFVNGFNALQQKTISYEMLSYALHRTNASFADNAIRALFFFGFIKPLCNVELRKNQRFFHKMNKKNGIEFEILAHPTR